VETIQINKALRIYLCSNSFWEYCLYHDNTFFNSRPFLQEIADNLQWIYDEYKEGRSHKISVSMPPRAGKSYITSLFCAWWLGKFPDLAVMRNSCTDKLFCKLSYDVRDIVKSDLWHEVFNNKLSDDKQNVHEWNLKTAKQTSYFGAGVGGTIIGSGANLAISDDLYRGMQDALSEEYNDKTHQWKESSHDSRKEKNCPEIYIGTRWALDDVIGRATSRGKIERSVIIPALIDGKSFCENVKSTADYLEIKADIEDFIWEAEYMQEPYELKGLLFPPAELSYFEPSKILTESFESAVSYIDVADEGTDYTAMPIGCNVKEVVYITDVVCNMMNSDVTTLLCNEMIRKHSVKVCRVETNSMGGMYLKEMRKIAPSYCSLVGAHSTTNKHTRILMASGAIKKHCRFLKPEHQSDEYKLFMKHFLSYKKDGGAKVDDPADAMSGLIRFIQSLFPHLYN
jgi:predicted phage terminase large subunit-like protein